MVDQFQGDKDSEFFYKRFDQDQSDTQLRKVSKKPTPPQLSKRKQFNQSLHYKDDHTSSEEEESEEEQKPSKNKKKQQSKKLHKKITVKDENSNEIYE